MTPTVPEFASKVPARYSLSVRMASQRGKVTQEEIGACIGKSREAVSLKMRGRSPWFADEMERLAYVFGADLAEMIGTDTAWMDRIRPNEVAERLVKIRDTVQYVSLERPIAVVS